MAAVFFIRTARLICTCQLNKNIMNTANRCSLLTAMAQSCMIGGYPWMFVFRNAHTHTHAHAHTRTHARTHTHTHARTHARTHANTHTHTHTLTHTVPFCPPPKMPQLVTSFPVQHTHQHLMSQTSPFQTNHLTALIANANMQIHIN